MTQLIASRGAQEVLCAEFAFNFDDTMLNTSGVEKDFGETNTASTVFEVANLPDGAVVVGGSLIRTEAFDAATYTVSVGDKDSATRYLGATDVKAVGSTALVPTGHVIDGQNPRITVVAADACTTGKAVLRIEFVIADRLTSVFTS